MRIWKTSVAATFCAAALAMTLGTAGAVTSADNGVSTEQGSGKPACGSVESFRLGAPYSGTINRGEGDIPVQLTPGAEKDRFGHVSAGPVTGSATFSNGEKFKIDSNWTAMDDMLTKAVANYQVRTTDGQEVGKVTCDAETGAISHLVAYDIDAIITGGEANDVCASGNCGGATGGFTLTPQQVERHITGTLTLTSDHSAS
ncbi:hypothetical protein [Streptomyces sp. S1]|uniref:hypothetical protein n=1 Tax=Streptomyces sp. S1 TaxID=718288 RepID=UPI003D746B9F